MNTYYIHEFLINIIFVNCFQLCFGADPNDVYRLRADILNNYDRHFRPTLQHNSSTFVDIYFMNFGFEFDEKKGVFTLHALIDFMWEDEHIKWNPLNYGNVSEVAFFPTELWRPDITVFNHLDKSEIDHFGNTLIIATNYSQMYHAPQAKFQVGCETDYSRWPMDIQQCVIMLGSWTYDGSEVYLHVDENHTTMNEPERIYARIIQNREWNLIENHIQRKIFNYPCCPGVPFIEVHIMVTIARRTSVHTAAVVTISFGISIAVLISFWLNPNAKERVPIILLAIILNSFYLNHIYSIIPYNGNAIPWAIVYFRNSLIMSQFSLMWTVLLRYISNTKRNTQVPLPGWLSNFLEGIIAKLLCLNPRPTILENITPKNTSSVGESDDGDELMKRENFMKEDWGWFANLLDRVLFVIYLILYIIYAL